MKLYQLTQADFERLILILDQNPEQSAGSSMHMSDETRRVYQEVHRFYNHRLRRWIDEVTQ